MMLQLPGEFGERMKMQLGDEADAFFHALGQPSPTSVRLHPAKGKAGFPLGEKIPWCADGYYLEARPQFHLDPHWHGGAYYVQEASSMILDAVISRLSLPDVPKIWLDLCAAPGGKSGILARHMATGDVLIANEINGTRRSILYENLVKGGYLNTCITGLAPSSFPASIADIILIDAPCAGEGMMRKEPEAIRQWTPQLVHSCSLLQRDIVRSAFTSLKPGGLMIYSTCSYSPQENINNVLSFLEAYGMECIPFSFPEEWNICTLHHEGATGYQLFPHRVKGEGLFFAVLKKQEAATDRVSHKKNSTSFFPVPTLLLGWLQDPVKFLTSRSSSTFDLITSATSPVAMEPINHLHGVQWISQAGELKGKDFIPSHFLAMSDEGSPSIPSVRLNQNEALDFLERKIPSPSPESAEGWHLAQYEGTNLGWLKKTSQGWKNHYPMSWRLRNRT